MPVSLHPHADIGLLAGPPEEGLAEACLGLDVTVAGDAQKALHAFKYFRE
ncbi:unnamed protein product [marine sediment metagenome]|uniref:Uncharacterized protein n=1 Tax=marine sediment metagenome TaxID=412755 RepID=X1VL75_9ZZZZ